MNILDKCNLTDDEADTAILLVNTFGHCTQQATEENIYLFTPNFILECCANALAAQHASFALRPEFYQSAANLQVKLLRHQESWGKLAA